MKLLSKNKDIEKKIIQLIKKYNKIYISVAWSTLGTEASSTLSKFKHKISQMIVGIDGFNTSPEFIKEFMDVEYVKYRLKKNGIFHQKIYLFYNSKNNWECLIGSANFTNGGMINNTELIIHIKSDDNTTKTFINDVLSEINKQYSLAYYMNEEKYQIYLEKFNQEKKSKKKINQSNKETEIQMADIAISKLSLKEYLDKVNSSKNGYLEKRLNLLKYVKEYFTKYKSLNQMPKNVVRQIAGTISHGEHDINWMHFGNMVSPRFRNRIIDTVDVFSEALDFIPSSKNVSKEMYMDYVSYINDNLESGYGVKSLSRLLAMKRPDIFYCITLNNQYPIYRDFYIEELKTHDYERYWDEVILNIHNTPWYKNTELKDDIEKQIWNNRAAMLDIITY